MTERELQECLLRGFGYRKVKRLIGEYIDDGRGNVINTLRSVDRWERDGSLPFNPLNYDAAFDDTEEAVRS